MALRTRSIVVGFVVDDAIVVLENVVRHMEMGKSRLEAALEGGREIAFTVLSMTLSLAAVFIPVLFMGGIVGRLFHEFAVVIMTAILISGFVSLSLTPIRCAAASCKAASAERHNALYRASERMFDAWRDAYGWTLNAVRAPPFRHADGHVRDAGRYHLFVHHRSQGIHSQPGHRIYPGADPVSAGRLL